jgi:hypothetical protein
MWQVAAATAVVDYDLCQDKMFQKSSKPRRLVKIAFVGSTATGDCHADVYFGSEKVMSIQNSAALTAYEPEKDWYWHSSKLFLPAGVPLRIIVTDAANSNPVYVGVDLQEMVM